MDAHERPIVTEDNKTGVRAGSTGNNVRYVLIASCALVEVVPSVSLLARTDAM